MALNSSNPGEEIKAVGSFYVNYRKAIRLGKEQHKSIETILSELETSLMEAPTASAKTAAREDHVILGYFRTRFRRSKQLPAQPDVETVS